MSLTKVSYAMITGAPVTPQDYGAVGDGATNDTAALQAMFATGLPWYIPAGTYKVSSTLTITSSGTCNGTIVAAAGFVGHLIDIVNPAYGTKLNIYGLNVYSTDVRPSPYGAGATIGIYVGPNATYFGNTPCPNVNLYGCRATRFSIGCWISTFNVTAFNCIFPQNDHNCLVFTYDTSYNQVNDVSLINCDMNSAASSVGQAYALRVGTIGNGTYVGNLSMGVNMLVQGCNFDGAPVYLDNILGLVYNQNYHEQALSYSYTGAAVVLGSAGDAYLQVVQLGACYFTNFYYAINIANSVTNLEIRPNTYGSIAYSAVVANKCEIGYQLKYWNGVPAGDTAWLTGMSEIQTNFSAGTDISQVLFGGISIFNDGLTNGSQVVQSTTTTTNWYPAGITNNGQKNISSIYGRFRSASAASSGIAGTQSGTTFTFATPSQARYFNGGDRITASAGGAIWIKSLDYVAGTAILDSSYSGAITISHEVVSFKTTTEGSAAPTTGTWRQGDIVWDTSATSGGYAGWICTVAGTPGTWKTFGLIS